jgi:RNA polymerase sigma factor (sigma-70 family)
LQAALRFLTSSEVCKARDIRQKRLARRAKTDRKAQQELLKELKRLIEREAGKQLGQGLDRDELEQEGRLGVLRAIQAYTPRRGASFATYARYWIHGEMRRAIANHGRTVRNPEYRVLAAGRERRARERVQHVLKRTPTDLEVAEEMGEPVEEVWRVQVETAPLTSVDALMEAAEVEDEDTAGPRPSESQIRYLRSDGRDPTGEPERVSMRKVLPEEVRKALRTLRPRDRLVLRMRYWGKLTRREITEKTGLTADAIRWSEDRALQALRSEENLREYWKFFWN